jgi:acetylornithine/N-succinyldiaminopimelate aminotransferase
MTKDRDISTDQSARPSHLLQAFVRAPITVDRGEGASFRDVEGRWYLDFISGIGVNALGYGHPRIVEAIRDQAGRCIHSSNLFHHPYQEALAQRLADWSGLPRVFFSNSGSEGVEAALKVVRLAGKRQKPARWKIIALRNSFHGRTTGALAVTGQPRYREPFEPLLDGVCFIDPDDCEALARVVDSDTVAVIAETIQGEGGIHPLSREFLCALRERTQRMGVFWIADETQCGLGRAGHRFAYQRYESIGLPDAVIAAKPLAGGLPLGATMFSERLAREIEPGMHGTTFGGGPLACRVALETLSVIENLLPRIRRAGAYLAGELRSLQSRHSVIQEVRCAGLMAGLQLAVPGHIFVEQALARGLAINCTHDTVLRLLPPFIVTDEEIDRAVATLDSVLA